MTQPLRSVAGAAGGQRRPLDRLGYWMFLSRWIQAPLYFGLIVAQVVYVWRFMIELLHLIELGFGGNPRRPPSCSSSSAWSTW